MCVCVCVRACGGVGGWVYYSCVCVQAHQCVEYLVLPCKLVTFQLQFAVLLCS